MRNLLLVSLMVACGGSKQEEQPAKQVSSPPEAAPKVSEKPAEPVASPEPPPDAKVTTCTVKATGGATFEQATELNSSYRVSNWHSPGMRAKMGYPDTGFVLGCYGPSIELTFQSKDGVKVPMTAGKYSIGGKAATATIAATLGTTSVTDGIGAVEITAFDAKHIAGTLDVEITTVPGAEPVKLVATFDFPCGSHSDCGVDASKIFP